MASQNAEPAGASVSVARNRTGKAGEMAQTKTLASQNAEPAGVRVSGDRTPSARKAVEKAENKTPLSRKAVEKTENKTIGSPSAKVWDDAGNNLFAAATSSVSHADVPVATKSVVKAALKHVVTSSASEEAMPVDSKSSSNPLTPKKIKGVDILF